MAVYSKPYLTPQEYLAIERLAEERSEYIDGEMVAMTGGSRSHNLIGVNLAREVSLQLKERACEVYANDQRVQVQRSGLYTYPDLVVVCGEPRFEDQHFDTLLNPTVIFEVLSPTTESYDRGRKFDQYRTLDSLAEYVLVSQDQPRIQQFLRQEAGRWLFAEVTGLASALSLPSIGCELRLAEVYGKVRFPSQETTAPPPS